MPRKRDKPARRKNKPANGSPLDGGTATPKKGEQGGATKPGKRRSRGVRIKAGAARRAPRCPPLDGGAESAGADSGGCGQDPVLAYALSVLAGHTPAGPLVFKACRRFLDDLDRQCQPDFPYIYSPAHADHYFRFVQENCCHSKGRWRGKHIRLEPWQMFIDGNIYGWLCAPLPAGALPPGVTASDSDGDSDDDANGPDRDWHPGTRRFLSAYIEIPKKNGKTLQLAPKTFYHMLDDSDGGAEIYSAATTKGQAKLVWGAAAEMLRYSPPLRRRFEIRRASNRIVCEATSAWFEPLSADENSGDGINPSLMGRDELHRWKNREFYDMLSAGSDTRREPLFIDITTAGDDRSAVARTEHDRSEKILSGLNRDDRHFAYIACADPDLLKLPDGWLNELAWRQANPNLGVGISLSKLRAAAESARQSPAKRDSFLRLRLGVWTSSASSLLDPRRIELCAGPYSPGELELKLKGRDCYTGVDLAAKLDLAAFVHVFPPEDPDWETPPEAIAEARRTGRALAEICPVPDAARWWIVPRFFIPEERAREREQTDKVPYRYWASRQLVDLTPGDIIDYRRIYDRLCADRETFNIRKVLGDAWQLGQMFREWSEDGFDIAVFPQVMSRYAEPTAHLLTLVTTGKIGHAGHETMVWNLRNLAVHTDNNQNMRPKKPDDKIAAKIDGATAAIMAIGGALAEDTGSVYEHRGLLSL